MTDDKKFDLENLTKEQTLALVQKGFKQFAANILNEGQKLLEDYEEMQNLEYGKQLKQVLSLNQPEKVTQDDFLKNEFKKFESVDTLKIWAENIKETELKLKED